MTSIERTAYSRFSQQKQYRKDELIENYAISETEIAFVNKNAKLNRRRLNSAVQLKIVQNIVDFMDQVFHVQLSVKFDCYYH